MNVGELKERLDGFPDDMEVIVDQHSDYTVIEYCEIVNAVPKNGWVMRTHLTMSNENKEQVKAYLSLG